MMDEIYSRLRLGGIALEDTSAIGIKENRYWEHAGQKVRDVNGSIMTGSAMKSPWGKKARYVWSASGPGVFDLPGFDHLEHLDIIEFSPIDPWTGTVAPGATTLVLPRTPVAGTVRLYHPLTREPEPFTIAGKTMSFMGSPQLKWEFTPHCVGAYIDSDKECDEDAARWSWRLEVEEV